MEKIKPFLKCIDNDKWSFDKLSDRRKQIAANFNDYCDPDNIPTSDKKASEWSVTETDKFPTYTGNERTLYINEVALKLGDITTEFTCGNKSNQRPTGTKVEITSISPLTLIAELVNMYDPDYGETRDKQLLDPANYEFQTALKKLSFNVALKVTFKFTYQYHIMTDSGPGPTQTSQPLSAEVDYADAVAKISFASTSVKTIDTFGALNGGYSVGSAALDDIRNTENSTPITQPDSEKFVDAIYNAMNDDFSLKDYAEFEQYVNIEVSSISIRIEGDGDNKDEAALSFAPLLLKAKSTVDDDVKGKGVDFVRMDQVGDMKIYFPGDEMKTSEATPSGATHTFSDLVCFIGGIEARDPRQNLNPRYSATDTNIARSSDWNLTPKFVLGPTISGVDTIPSMAISNNEVAANGGRKNRHVNPAVPSYAPSADPSASYVDIAAADVDKEAATDPAWKGDNHGGHVSTAYIRNAPMVSPWEIGLIHRGREWQTLNIKRAGGFGSGTAAEKIKIEDIDSDYGAWDEDVGTTYQNGDGAILEFIKVGVSCRCMGKVPLKQLRKENIGDPADQENVSNLGSNGIPFKYNRDIVRMLFDGIRAGQTMKQFYAETKFNNANTDASQNYTPHGGTELEVDAEIIKDFVTAIDSVYSGDEALRSQFLNTKYGDKDSGYTFGMAINLNNPSENNDAGREEIIGKTINLLTADEVTPPNVFRVIVVAQSIRDIGGIRGVGGIDTSIEVNKGNNHTLRCLLGRFDFIGDSDNWENNTYFDEITGEVKALVTIERIPQTNDIGESNKDYGRMVVTGFEFIE